MSSEAESLKAIINILAMIAIALIIFLALALKKMNDDWHEINDLSHRLDEVYHECRLKPKLTEDTIGL